LPPHGDGLRSAPAPPQRDAHLALEPPERASDRPEESHDLPAQRRRATPEGLGQLPPRDPPLCPICSQRRLLTDTTAEGTAICGRCASSTRTYECVQCGQFCAPYRGGRCARDVLHERVQAILANPTSGDGLGPLAAALTAADNPRAVIRWLAGPTGQALTTLATTGQPLSHAALDALPPGPVVGYLRSLLVHAGVLQPRQDYLERVIPWLDRHLADQPAHHAKVIRPFAMWDVLARARRGAHHRPTTSATSQYLRQKIHIALDLLTWLDAHDIALADLTQHHLDQYLAGGTPVRYRVRGFITWLRHSSVGVLRVGDDRAPRARSAGQTPIEGNQGGGEQFGERHI